LETLMTRLLLLLPFALFACDGGKDAANDDTSDSQPSCEIEIDSTVPASGAVDAYYRAPIEFTLSDADPTATITTDIPGSQVTSEDGKTIKWVPTDPLAPSTSYTVTLDYCHGSADLAFTTSALGTPIPDSSSLVGMTYTIDLANARIVEPAGIGSVLTSQLQQNILVGVQSVDASSIQMIGAIATDGTTTQNYCDPTIPFPAADFSAAPYFTVGPQTTTLSVAGYNVEIQDLEITGTFAADGSYFGGGTLSGTIDTRPLAPLLDDSGNEGAICDLAVNFGAQCQACPSDGEPYCLTLVADQITATSVSGTLSEVDGQDCTGCESGPPAPDATCAEDTGGGN
jgi:hypothetical protein